MFDFGEPWWQLVARAVIVYIVLMVLARLSGKRTVGEFTPFDLVVVLLISEATQGALTGSDHSVPGGLLLAATLIGVNYGVGFASARSKPARSERRRLPFLAVEQLREVLEEGALVGLHAQRGAAQLW